MVAKRVYRDTSATGQLHARVVPRTIDVLPCTVDILRRTADEIPQTAEGVARADVEVRRVSQRIPNTRRAVARTSGDRLHASNEVNQTSDDFTRSNAPAERTGDSVSRAEDACPRTVGAARMTTCAAHDREDTSLKVPGGSIDRDVAVGGYSAVIRRRTLSILCPGGQSARKRHPRPQLSGGASARSSAYHERNEGPAEHSGAAAGIGIHTTDSYRSGGDHSRMHGFPVRRTTHEMA